MDRPRWGPRAEMALLTLLPSSHHCRHPVSSSLGRYLIPDIDWRKLCNKSGAMTRRPQSCHPAGQVICGCSDADPANPTLYAAGRDSRADRFGKAHSASSGIVPKRGNRRRRRSELVGSHSLTRA
ncbi:hypothetical protein L1887_56594 [Cichorium endivia]|nr:hypothetical protein L1887_56594 [Cichorium endivia]